MAIIPYHFFYHPHSDLLKVPPGFLEGMEFASVSAGGVSSSAVPTVDSEPLHPPPQTVSISELLTGGGVLLEWARGEEEGEGGGDGDKGSSEEVSVCVCILLFSLANTLW